MTQIMDGDGRGKPDLKPIPGKEHKRNISDVVALAKFLVLPESTTPESAKKPRTLLEAQIVDPLIKNVTQRKITRELMALGINTWIQLAPMRIVDETSRATGFLKGKIATIFNKDADCKPSEIGRGKWTGADYAVAIRFGLAAANTLDQAQPNEQVQTESGWVMVIMSKADAIILTNHIYANPGSVIEVLEDLKLIDTSAPLQLSNGEPAEIVLGTEVAVLSNTHLQPEHLKNKTTPGIIRETKYRSKQK